MWNSYPWHCDQRIFCFAHPSATSIWRYKGLAGVLIQTSTTMTEWIRKANRINCFVCQTKSSSSQWNTWQQWDPCSNGWLPADDNRAWHALRNACVLSHVKFFCLHARLNDEFWWAQQRGGDEFWVRAKKKRKAFQPLGLGLFSWVLE